MLKLRSDGEIEKMNQQENKFKVMMVTVGGTTEPIIKSIMMYQPEKIYFFPSQSTNPKIHEILSALDYKPEQITRIIENENDLLECFNKCDQVCREIVRQNIVPAEVIIDYTGGTKNMTVAMALAAAGKGFYFSYVGGHKRDKDGVGIVISGNEELYQRLDPLESLKINQKNQLRNYFNEYKFDFALEICQKLAEGSGKDKVIFTYLANIINGYRLWDRFKHRDAVFELNSGVKKFSDLLHFSNHEGLNLFISECETNLLFLNKLNNTKNNNSKISRELILDLLANAKRRTFEKKYDDSVARLYRSLEMIAQLAFYNHFGFTTSNVPFAEIPEEIKDKYQKYVDQEQFIKIGLTPSFYLLNFVGNQVGKTFMEEERKFTSFLKTRNESILAHGSIPIDQETNTNFFAFICEKFSLSDLPVFPKMPDLN